MNFQSKCNLFNNCFWRGVEDILLVDKIVSYVIVILYCFFCCLRVAIMEFVCFREMLTLNCNNKVSRIFNFTPLNTMHYAEGSCMNRISRQVTSRTPKILTCHDDINWLSNTTNQHLVVSSQHKWYREFMLYFKHFARNLKARAIENM